MSASDEHRLVALRLHGLADSDRRWLLSRLADGDRIKLEGYLHELKGFQLDPETLAELEQRIAAPTARGGQRTAAKEAPDHAAEQLLAAEPLWLSRLLQASAEHRLDDSELTVTPRVREVAQAAFQRRLASHRHIRKGDDVVVGERKGYATHSGIMTRLRAAWLR